MAALGVEDGEGGDAGEGPVLGLRGGTDFFGGGVG